MATSIYARKTKTHPRAIPQNGYRDMTVANAVITFEAAATDAVTPVERFFFIAAVAIVSITRSGDVATVTVSGAHGYLVGMQITIAGTGEAAYNGTFTIATVPTTSTFTYAIAGSPTTPAGGSKTLQSAAPIFFWSERVATEVTISGSITFAIRSLCVSGFTGRLRAKLYKITTGGSNVETLIAQADASADITTTATTYTFSVTPPSPVTVAPNERFICRVSAMPVAGSFGTNTASIQYGSGSTSEVKVTFTETFTFRLNGVTLVGRVTTASGIGNFYDLSETTNTGAGSTAVVNTVASGTEIQWTRTAGGTVLEWISQRIAAPGWTVDVIASFGIHRFAALESNAAANCTARLKIFRRKPNGTELLVATWTYTSVEFPTSSTNLSMTVAMGSLAQVTNFVEDDRLVARYYIVPFTALTMGGPYTCTLTYDVNSQTSQVMHVLLFDAPEFKAGGDPDGVTTPPSGLATMGMGT